MRKKLIFFCLVFFAIANRQMAQPVLYGVTGGGEFGGGTISKFESSNNNITAAYAFKNDPKFPSLAGDLIQAADGKLYGMTAEGGNYGQGTLFLFEPVSNSMVKVHDFDNANGSSPSGSMVQGGFGKLYGVTNRGGSNGSGTIFSFDPAANKFTKVHEFDNANGGAPYGSLVYADNGRLYGMTYQGGSNGYGIIFSFDPVSNGFSKLHDFNNAGGRSPYGSLVQAGNGKLYGMTYGGGTNGYGIIFSFDPVSNGFSKLHDFNNTNGRSPFGSLVQASNGKLYGMTYQGGSSGLGTIFSFDPVNNIHARLQDFSGGNGSLPYHNSLVEASNGRLYGLTYQGGSSGLGTIFTFDPESNIHMKLHDFDNSNGRNPRGSLAKGSNGKLYGMTYQGGSSGYGSVFSFDILSATHNKLYDFSDPNGSVPRGSLLQAGNGKFYGMTSTGGSNGVGTVFSFDPSGKTHNKLHDFNGLDGSTPRGSLLQASDDKIYGMTYGGGSSGFGTIFSFDPVDNLFEKLHDFNKIDGSFPFGNLMQGSDGKLYGMTHEGGSSDAGTIFSFDPVANTFTKLHDFFNTDFSSSNGSFPYGSLVQANDGKLYGMTYRGGMPISDDIDINIYGTIFSFDPVTKIYSKVHEFDVVNGSSPYGNLVQAGNGKLYGTTYKGGNSDVGTIFSFEPISKTFIKLHEFENNFGFPYGSMVLASNGLLYGITSKGGSDSINGTIFSLDPATGLFHKLQDYADFNHLYPTDGTLIEANACPQVQFYEDNDGDGFGNPEGITQACNIPPGYVADSTDCNDNNAAVYPGAAEICNGMDDDCDGQIDENLQTTFYTDSDGDGYGDVAITIRACAVPPGYVADSSDCNDGNAGIYPGATEKCNGIDDDCDGLVDEGVQTTFYADADSDGYGNAEITIQACTKPSGYVTNSGDCNDNNNSIHPGAPEVTGNNLDENCNGLEDEGRVVIWPNPASLLINLRIFDPTLYGKLQVEMVDKNGRMVKQWVRTYNTSGDVMELELGNLASGIYVIIIKANKVPELTYKLAVIN